MANTQELNRRIKSVKSTRKITRAMQMVSASKMRKSQAATLGSRSYAHLAWGLLDSLYTFEHAELEEIAERELSLDEDEYEQLRQRLAKLILPSKNAKKICVIVISTNRGLVGSFNANLIPLLLDLEKIHGRENIDYITFGRKGSEVITRLKRSLTADFAKPDTLVSSEVIYPIVKSITEQFASGKYKQVSVVYNKFVSTISQKSELTQLLPLLRPVAEEHDPTQTVVEYQFEPSPIKVLEHLLPRIIESQLYQCLLESDASEHSARMVMMKNATDSAGDIIADLTLTYNQLRQGKITTELAEITAGKVSLEQRSS